MSDIYFDDKELKDLQWVKPTREQKEKPFTDTKKDQCLKYLRWQNGCTSTEENKEYIGKGDVQICKLVGITKTQLVQFRANLTKKIVELTPKPIEPDPIEDPVEDPIIDPIKKP